MPEVALWPFGSANRTPIPALPPPHSITSSAGSRWKWASPEARGLRKCPFNCNKQPDITSSRKKQLEKALKQARQIQRPQILILNKNHGMC